MHVVHKLQKRFSKSLSQPLPRRGNETNESSLIDFRTVQFESSSPAYESRPSSPYSRRDSATTKSSTDSWEESGKFVTVQAQGKGEAERWIRRGVNVEDKLNKDFKQMQSSYSTFSGKKSLNEKDKRKITKYIGHASKALEAAEKVATSPATIIAALNLFQIISGVLKEHSFLMGSIKVVRADILQLLGRLARGTNNVTVVMCDHDNASSVTCSEDHDTKTDSVLSPVVVTADASMVTAGVNALVSLVYDDTALRENPELGGIAQDLFNRFADVLPVIQAILKLDLALIQCYDAPHRGSSRNVDEVAEPSPSHAMEHDKAELIRGIVDRLVRIAGEHASNIDVIKYGMAILDSLTHLPDLFNEDRKIELKATVEWLMEIAGSQSNDMDPGARKLACSALGNLAKYSSLNYVLDEYDAHVSLFTALRQTLHDNSQAMIVLAHAGVHALHLLAHYAPHQSLMTKFVPEIEFLCKLARHHTGVEVTKPVLEILIILVKASPDGTTVAQMNCVRALVNNVIHRCGSSHGSFDQDTAKLCLDLSLSMGSFGTNDYSEEQLSALVFNFPELKTSAGQVVWSRKPHQVNDNMCSICHTEHDNNVFLMCKHKFCAVQLSRWMHSGNSLAAHCPNCKQPHYGIFFESADA